MSNPLKTSGSMGDPDGRCVGLVGTETGALVGGTIGDFEGDLVGSPAGLCDGRSVGGTEMVGEVGVSVVGDED
jgi:hypothetical protein